MRCILALALTMLATNVSAAEKPTPVIIDTDLGSDIDDAFALALAIASPELEIAGVTTVSGDTTIRAKMALRLLHAAGLPKVPVAAGAKPQPESEITGQYQYYYHPAVLYNRAGQPQKQAAVDLLHQTLAAREDKLTLVALGPLTNVARLLKEHPGDKSKIERVVIMGGSLARNYEGEEQPVAEWNIKADIAAAKAVFESGVPLVVVPLDAAWNLKFEREARQKFFAKKSLLTMQVEALYQMWREETPVLFDALAIAALVDDKHCTWDKLKLGVTDAGITQAYEAGEPNARVAIKADPQKFVDWYVDRVSKFGATQLPRKLANETKTIEDNRFPARVHAFEDFETDIEKRWWLAGRLEEKDVPPNSRRALRSQLTLDFDDLQGQLDTMYSAVVFNPVPGPPMGPNTRLKFRYRLIGTDELRVQLYSLSNGYHRYLSLKGLPQDEWREATVDMTAMRRPDGSGGPLAKDERIDDIQFYVDPRSEVLIDDIVLYDPGSDDEQRPFPKRLHFTGWFDTGKQGQEWPGEFEIVEHTKPRTWKTAKSKDKNGSPVLEVSVRGDRSVGANVKLDFRYRLEEKTDELTVTLGHSKNDHHLVAVVEKPAPGEWQTATLAFPHQSDKPLTIDQIRFDVSSGTTLFVDDLLLYEP